LWCSRPLAWLYKRLRLRRINSSSLIPATVKVLTVENMKFTISVIVAAIGVLRVHGILTQQDPSQLLPGEVDPRNHYYLELDGEHTASASPNENATLRLDFAPFDLSPAGVSPTGALLCSASTTCPDASCCGPDNICGFGDDYCSKPGCQNNCEAKAPCGKNSLGGSTGCGMNLCCSHYGWCGVTADYCSTTGPTPCQSGFGSCSVKSALQCDPSKGSATHRTVGYYQGGNVYSAGRVCNQITPGDIKLDGYTHL